VELILGQKCQKCHFFDFAFRNAAVIRWPGRPNEWGQETKLTPQDGAQSNYFGFSVSLDGSVALIGATGNNAYRGAAYIFERNTGGTNAWGQVVKLLAPEGASGDGFGNAVSVAEYLALIGAEWDDLGGILDSGSAYVFHRNAAGPDAWGLVAQLTASDADDWDRFGHAVSLNGDIVLIGAPWETIYEGKACVFERHFPVPETAIEEMQIQGPEVVCAWTSEVPVDYTLQVSESMDDGASWSNLTGSVDLPGVDGMITVTNDLDAGLQHFYRVKTVNSPIR